MGRDVLLKDMDGSARLFYQQIHTPGFSAGWQSLIEDEALDTIRDEQHEARRLHPRPMYGVAGVTG